MKSHTHDHSLPVSNYTTSGGNPDRVWHASYGTNSTSATGGNETRPVNAYVNWIVKY
ncbi:MAG: hypothetical protein IPH52_11555 [Leptospiraceae bacterium]|nr:hypothetical protein [Leptospiraceae bacterium]